MAAAGNQALYPKNTLSGFLSKEYSTFEPLLYLIESSLYAKEKMWGVYLSEQKKWEEDQFAHTPIRVFLVPSQFSCFLMNDCDNSYPLALHSL